MIARIRSSWSAIRFGVKPRWNSALMRSCLGGSMPMNIARTSSSGKISANTVTPPSSEEYVSQSRLTAWTSSAVVTDQKPASSGYWSMRSDQCTGHLPRISLNSSYGGPSFHSSPDASSTPSIPGSTVAI